VLSKPLALAETACTQPLTSVIWQRNRSAKEVPTVFHPVPRADPWDGVISGMTALLIAALLVASFLVAR